VKREILFRKGINLIVDESEGQITGNNIGKTTVLKLIDFCLGAEKKHIWEDPESKKEVYSLVKNFLIDNNVVIVLELSPDLNGSDTDDIIIHRNFLSRSKIIRKINDQEYTEDEFEPKLKELIFKDVETEKPSFRQIISHNIRYKDLSLNNTLKTLDGYTADTEYETLYLYLLGCDFRKGNDKQLIVQKLKQEESFKRRLEKIQTKSAYEAALSIINTEIDNLKERKSNLNLNKEFEKQLNELNQVKYSINQISSSINKLSIRKDIIVESKAELNQQVTKIDLDQLELIYEQASDKIGELQKSFEDLVDYHNKMIKERIAFVGEELPKIERGLNTLNSQLSEELRKEEQLSNSISKTDSFQELEDLISKMNTKFQRKGEYENKLESIVEVETIINELKVELKEINEILFSDDFEKIVKNQINKFNKYFSAISNSLYNEQYALKYDIKTNRQGQRVYKFSAFNTNFSSGKKQGEISCFDMAYINFARENNIPSLSFLLNDKKELMHDNQLIKIARLAKKQNIQFVASILKDKLPAELNNEEYFVVRLSEKDKLFRIER